jgi:hypothetical protein
VGHAIDLTPPEGIPDREPDDTVAAPDPSARTGQPTIRRTGDKTARKLLRQLRARPAKPTEPQPEPAAAPPPQGPAPPEQAPAPPPPAAPDSAAAPIKAGDPLAALARKRKRKKRQRPDH